MLNANINIKETNKQLSVKAYLMNKYEKLKVPAQNLSDSQTGNFFIENLNDTRLHNTQAIVGQPEREAITHVINNHDQLGRNNNGLVSMQNQRSFNNGSSNEDDDDDDYDEHGKSNRIQSKEEKRRISHTTAEQKRRNAIKRGYDDLQSLVPSCDYMDPSSSQKVCKATILSRSIDYIQDIQTEENAIKREVESLNNEMIALKIMKSHYEEILRQHRNLPKNNNSEVNDDTKFELFTNICDHLYQTFDRATTTSQLTSFPALSNTMLNWVEQACTSQNLKQLVSLSLMEMQPKHN